MNQSFNDMPAESTFSISWNGRALHVHPARVSARPLNKVWDGAQRPVEQTKIASFVSFDMDAPGTLEIRDVAECGAPVFLPLGSAPEWRREDGVLRVVIDRPRQFVVSFPDGEALHVFANPPFDEGAATRQQGAPAAPRKIRRFGPGEYHVGVVVAESDETIVIEEGAVVYGTVLVANAHDVRVVGRGIIDGSFLDRASHDSAAFRAAVAAGEAETADKLHSRCCSLVDKAAKAGTIHGNKASNKKSQFDKLMNTLSK